MHASLSLFCHCILKPRLLGKIEATCSETFGGSYCAQSRERQKRWLTAVSGGKNVKGSWSGSCPSPTLVVCHRFIAQTSRLFLAKLKPLWPGLKAVLLQISKLIWFILLIVGSSLTFLSLYNVVSDYLAYGISTTVKIETVSSQEFPAVTICNHNR